jgi:pimeloyl-ACP methyl ester carboxylesterase
MSKSTYLARLVLIAALPACLAACAPASRPSAPGTTAPTGQAPASGTTGPTTSALPWPCLDGSGATPLAISAVPTLRAAQLGTGSRAVVFSDQSDENGCAWEDFAAELTGLGYRAVLYDYTNEDPPADLAAVVRTVAASGATNVALVGASKGAKTSIIVAADSPSVHALVSLSAESTLGETDVAPYAARLTTPTLFVTADQDAYGATTATRSFYAAAPASDKTLLIRPGTAHGTALLTDAEVHQAIVKFLGRHDG